MKKKIPTVTPDTNRDRDQPINQATYLTKRDQHIKNKEQQHHKLLREIYF